MQNLGGVHAQTYLYVAFPLLVLPCVMLDRLGKLKNAHTAPGFLSSSGFDDCWAISERKSEKTVGRMPRASRGSSFLLRFIRRMVYD